MTKRRLFVPRGTPSPTLKHIVTALMMAFAISAPVLGASPLTPQSSTDNDWELKVLTDDFTFTSENDVYLYGIKRAIDGATFLTLTPQGQSLNITGKPVHFSQIARDELNKPESVIEVSPNVTNRDQTITWDPAITVDWDNDNGLTLGYFDPPRRFLTMDNRNGQSPQSGAITMIFNGDITLNAALHQAYYDTSDQIPQVFAILNNARAIFNGEVNIGLKNYDGGKKDVIGVSLDDGSSLRFNQSVTMNLIGNTVFNSAAMIVQGGSTLESSSESTLRVELTNLDSDNPGQGSTLSGLWVKGGTVDLRGNTIETIKMDRIDYEGSPPPNHYVFGLRATPGTAPANITLNQYTATLSGQRPYQMAGVFVNATGTESTAREIESAMSINELTLSVTRTPYERQYRPTRRSLGAGIAILNGTASWQRNSKHTIGMDVTGATHITLQDNFDYHDSNGLSATDLPIDWYFVRLANAKGSQSRLALGDMNLIYGQRNADDAGGPTGFSLDAQTGGKNQLTVTGALQITQNSPTTWPTLFEATTDATGTTANATADLTFTGSADLRGVFLRNLAQANHAGASITLAPEGEAFLTGNLVSSGDLKLSLTGSNQHYWGTSTWQKDVNSASTLEVSLANGATWHYSYEQDGTFKQIDDKSTLSHLTLTGGIVDFTNADPNETNWTNIAGEDETKAVMMTQSLEGTGTFRFEVDFTNERAQRLQIGQTSQGTFKVDVKNRPSFRNSSANPQPILLVEALEGDVHPEHYQARFYTEASIEVGELEYNLARTQKAFGVTTDTSTVRRRLARSVTDTSEETSTVPSNTQNWYLYVGDAEVTEPVVPPSTDPEPETPPPEDPPAEDPPTETPQAQPDPTPSDPTAPVTPPLVTPFTHGAKGFIASAHLHYLGAIAPLETLRERMGDIHLGLAQEGVVTPWAKVEASDWRVNPALTPDRWHLHLRHAKVGADYRLNPTSLVGGYLAYTDLDAKGLPETSARGYGVEAGAYLTLLSKNRTFMDLVGRVGQITSKFATVDTLGAPVSARNLDTPYAGLNLTVGRQVALTEHVFAEPMAFVGYTHFGHLRGTTDAGLAAKTEGYASLLTQLGSTLEGRFTTQTGRPWMVFAKAAWEKEWLADTSIRFNGGHAYALNLKDSRFVYGLGAEGRLGKASTWHIDVQRTTGERFRANWEVNANVRIPF